MTETVTVETKTVETRAFDGTMESAHNKEIKDYGLVDENDKPVTAVNFAGSYEHVLSYDAIPAKELPDKDDILKFVNDARKANARQKAMQAALDAAGIKKPTLESDVDLQVRTMVKVLLASGKHTAESAEAAAKAALGL